MYFPYSGRRSPVIFRTSLPVLFLTLLVSLGLYLSGQPQAVPFNDSTLNLELNALPLSFVPNEGQTDPAVQFTTHDFGGTLYFAEDEIVVSLPSVSSPIRIQFEDVNPNLTAVGGEQLSGTVNYFIGNDPEQWHTNLPIYAGIVYQQLYTGIDLAYDGANGQLKGTYLVAPGIDPGQIRWHYDGTSGVQLDRQSGHLLIAVPGKDQAGATLIEQAPVAWQIVDGRRVAVSASYALAADGSVGFALGNYDDAYPLVIDPTLVYSTFLGSGGRDDGEGVVIDGDGNALVVGSTNSAAFPPETGGGDVEDDNVFITKINSAGTGIVYTSILGGGGNDHGNDIAVDAAGNAYVTGATYSHDFPLENAYQSAHHCTDVLGTFICAGNAFVAKLNLSGSNLLYSTYLGGDTIDIAESIAVDGNGSAYVTGFTAGNFPITAGAARSNNQNSTDAFVSKLGSAGNSLTYSTYLGGGEGDIGTGIDVDGAGNAYVVGETNSSDFPGTGSAASNSYSGEGDAFVAKMNATGSALVYGRFLGGDERDEAADVAVYGDNAIVVGETESANFPTTGGVAQGTHGGGVDAFVVRLNGAGTGLEYGTFLGGSGTDVGTAAAVDGSGNAYVTGQTQSANFPTENALQSSYAGTGDVFVTKLNGGGTLAYSTFLGGSQPDLGDGIAVDGTGQAVVTGITYSTNFTTTDGVLQPVYGDGDFDAFVVKISDEGDETLPPPPGTVNLAGSVKYASQVRLGPGEQLTYFINLHNSGTETAVVDVVDEVPEEVVYVSGSIDDKGDDSDPTRLTWSDVAVPGGADVLLEFKVTGTAVTEPELVVNTAVINPDGSDAFERHFPILLLPDIPDGDVTPPTVHSVTIGTQDVLTDPDVTLHIDASDNVGVTEMLVKEWYLSTDPLPHWQLVESSGWIPFQASYDLTLLEESGTHFVTVWVADEAGNISHLDKNAADFASLLLPGESVSQGGLVPYLVHYDEGEAVSATLETLSGDADLFVWFPGNFGKPDEQSTNAGTAVDTVSFTAPKTGTYLFLVFGFQSSTYNLAISPGGGPRATMSVDVETAVSIETASPHSITGSKSDLFDFEPVLTISGMDPMSSAGTPAAPNTIFLPLVVR